MKNLLLILSLLFSSTSFCCEFLKQLPRDVQHIPLRMKDNVSVSFFMKKSVNKNAENIIFINGGPGGSSHSSIKKLSKISSLNNFNLILFDQRGNGCSSPFPESKDLNFIAKDAFRYTSHAIVKDLEQFRRIILKSKKVHLFSQSYGSLVARRYLLQHPGVIKSITTHGFSTISNPHLYRYFFMKDSLKKATTFFRQYPRTKSKFKETLRNEMQKLCKSNTKKCYIGLMRGLGQRINQNLKWDQLAKELDVLHTKSKDHAAIGFKYTSHNDFKFTPRLAYIITLASYDYLGQVQNPHDPYFCFKGRNNLRNKSYGESINPFLFDCKETTSWEQKLLKGMYKKASTAILPQNILKVLEANKEVRFVSLSAGQDVFATDSYFKNDKELSIRLENFNYFHLKNQSHSGWSDPLTIKILITNVLKDKVKFKKIQK